MVCFPVRYMFVCTKVYPGKYMYQIASHSDNRMFPVKYAYVIDVSGQHVGYVRMSEVISKSFLTNQDSNQNNTS